MHTITETADNVVTVKVSGKLTDTDYQNLIPKWENAIKLHGSLRLLFEMDDFHGWDLHAAWDEFKFGIKNRNKIERVAMIGDERWEKWISKLGAMFVQADVRYFDWSEFDEAENWIHEV